ncbi:MAG: SEC-C domain-containing protein [Solirubrobacteraceae bacterium]
MGASPRNAPCPCGSGLKHKRCCMAAESREREMTRFEDAVGTRISGWAADFFGDEMKAARDEFEGSGPALDDSEFQIFITWFCSDRELAGGLTLAECYSARRDIDERQRDVATRIAAARLSLQRVRAVEPGRWIELEDVLHGSHLRVRSAGVSREVALWDVMLCRVMGGDQPSLWGPVSLYAPHEEPELVAELHRLAATHGLPSNPRSITEVFHVDTLDLMRFVPPSRRVEPSFLTAEGDPLVDARAIWTVTDASRALDLLDCSPQLVWVGDSDDGTGEAIQLTCDRAQLVAGRPALPPGALCFESSLTELPGRLCLATFDLTDEELRCTAVSETRLDTAIELIEQRLGELAELRGRTIQPLELDLSRESSSHRAPPPGFTAAEAHELKCEAINDHFHNWLDQPLEPLHGLTPRQAAHSGPHDELELLIRGIENRADRSRRNGESWPDISWLRHELGLQTSQLAA